MMKSSFSRSVVARRNGWVVDDDYSFGTVVVGGGQGYVWLFEMVGLVHTRGL